MFNGQYRSIQTVIENVLRDNDYYNDMDQDDATEWAIRAMELIGAPLVYTISVSPAIEINNYRAILPVNIRRLIAVRDHKSRHTFVEATGEFIMKRNEYAENPPDQSDPESPVIPVRELKAEDKGLFLPTYKVVNGALFFNVKKGKIDLKYESFPIDDEGCLMIPDEDRYMLAVESYIKHKMDHKLWRRGVLSKLARDLSEQDWLWYVQSAHSKIVTPGYDGAEALKNQIQKMRTDKNAHDYGFEYLNLPTVKRF